MSKIVEFEVLRAVRIKGKGYPKGAKVDLDAESLDARYMLGQEQIKPATKAAQTVVNKINESKKS